MTISQKCHLPETLIEHAAGHLGVPVVDGGEDHEEDRADQHVVEMSDDEVGVVQLPVPRRDREHDAGEPGDEPLEEERDGEQHRRGEADLAAPHGRQPVEGLDAGGDGDQHGREREEGVAERGHADGEHVVRPHAQADEADADRGGDHRRIAEDRFAREDGDDLVGEAEGGKHEDVDLGVPEDPEEVRPEDGGAAGLRVEEVAAEIAVDHAA